jgi:hypothetical protein
MNKPFIKVTSTVVAIIAMWIIASGCFGPNIVNTTDRTRVPIAYGSVESNIRIIAEDGSFELRSGEQFNAPFQSDLWNCYGLIPDKLLESYDSALNCGAKRVKIYVGDNPEPLYGVFALNQAIRAAYGPASRSYVIKVADDKINSARVGNTAVSFERMNWKITMTVDGMARSRDQFGYGWLLWMSKYPL